jgi:hypothetical protein
MLRLTSLLPKPSHAVASAGRGPPHFLQTTTGRHRRHWSRWAGGGRPRPGGSYCAGESGSLLMTLRCNRVRGTPFERCRTVPAREAERPSKRPHRRATARITSRPGR